MKYMGLGQKQIKFLMHSNHLNVHSLFLFIVITENWPGKDYNVPWQMEIATNTKRIVEIDYLNNKQEKIFHMSFEDTVCFGLCVQLLFQTPIRRWVHF